MYRVLDQSHVVWNHTIGPTADNMRLFEATGIGACLLTDQKPNISEHFESDYEIVTYRSPEECVERAKWLLDHPDEGRRIGAAARSRTLRSHTYQHRAVELDQIIQQALVQISRRQYRGRHGE
jgi:spore maturation protein CgeB